MTAGRALRQKWEMDRLDATPCECGHLRSEHRELQPTYELRDGEIVTTEHPDYRPGEFHCTVDGCECVR